MKLKFSDNRNYDVEVFADKNFSDVIKTLNIFDFKTFSGLLRFLERIIEDEEFKSIKIVDDRGYFFYYRKLGNTWKRVYPPFPISYGKLVTLF